jgi:hypothetical protein
MEYFRFFDWLKANYNLHAKIVVIDFEFALFKAIKDVWLNVQLNGYLFHLSQIFWRKLASLGLVICYNNDLCFAQNTRLILALCFVPVHLIDDYIFRLDKYFKFENSGDDILLLLNWFKKDFCNFNNENNHHPLFWSVYERTLKSIPRTTNSLEGYHRHLNATFTTTKEEVKGFLKIC